MLLGKVVKGYMAQEGVSLRQLAKEVGVDHCTIENIVKEDTDPVAYNYFKFFTWLMTPTSSNSLRKVREKL